jgi:ornithine carbamoyltransferase
MLSLQVDRKKRIADCGTAMDQMVDAVMAQTERRLSLATARARQKKI